MKLKKDIEKILSDFFGEEVFLSLEKDAARGDYATSIALKKAKELKKNPREIAQDFIDKFPKNDFIERIDVAGAGFINFFLKPEAVQKELVRFNPEESFDYLKDDKVCIDFSHPNIAKPLHFGHFRSTVIGESFVRILRHSGADVLADNYLGDWGTQFGKLIVAIRNWGDAEAIKADPIGELVRLYRRFHDEAEKNPELEKQGAEEFRKMEQEKNEENLREWRWIIDVSLAHLQKFYDRIDANFDVIRGESYWEKYISESLKELKDKKVAKIDQGALVAFFGDESKLPPMIYRRSDGASLYQTRDIARIRYYENEDIDHLIYVVGSDQKLHFRQLIETAKMLGYKTKITHATFGMIRLPEGKMSTRKGRVIELDEVLDEAENRACTILKERGVDFPDDELDILKTQIAMGAIKFNDLSQNRTHDIMFDWDKMLSFEGFSAPFLQYSHARARSILRKAEGVDIKIGRLENEYEIELAKKILNFEQAVLLSADTLKPNLLAEYLFELAGVFNRFYGNLNVLNADDIEKSQRLYLIDVFTRTLKKGLSLLGIESPERM
ncbi:MAG: arginine--tRNA ligase [Candidatus Gracilibacteria bacterium]|jgi:arginyl-tRNA synthetase|nr:arginine--tRNA ligase [Candidatus Gracilibacteria bacterium]